jgi:hypothetical protein
MGYNIPMNKAFYFVAASFIVLLLVLPAWAQDSMQDNYGYPALPTDNSSNPTVETPQPRTEETAPSSNGQENYMYFDAQHVEYVPSMENNSSWNNNFSQGTGQNTAETYDSQEFSTDSMVGKSTAETSPSFFDTTNMELEQPNVNPSAEVNPF